MAKPAEDSLLRDWARAKFYDQDIYSVIFGANKSGHKRLNILEQARRSALEQTSGDPPPSLVDDPTLAAVDHAVTLLAKSDSNLAELLVLKYLYCQTVREIRAAVGGTQQRTASDTREPVFFIKGAIAMRLHGLRVETMKNEPI